MKIIFTLAASILFLFATNCNNTVAKSDSMEISGIIEPIGMTTWQYGSHTISNEEGVIYALRSESVRLEEYEGKMVTIKGEKVDGYPVENGPEFIEVTEIID